MTKKVPYTFPLVKLEKQRMTLEQFKRDFDTFLAEDPDFKDAIITGARLIDNPKDISDGAIVFDCYLQKFDCKGTFTVPVTDPYDIQ